MRRPAFLRRHLDRRARNERGMAIAWFGLTIMVLIAFAGFGVDVAHFWYEGQREQQAADAAAHAGVVFLPADMAQATWVARIKAAENGFNDGVLSSRPVNATVTVTQEPNPNRLRVKIQRTVPSFFVRLIGVADPNIDRQAVAEYVAPVPMGSPENKLGNDPENGFNPQLWLNTAGPNATKVSGDRYAAKNCDNTIARCNSSATPPNLEYSQDGYFFTADVKGTVAGEPLKFDFYDAQMVFTGDYCEQNMPTNPELVTLATWYPDAAARYQRGTSSPIYSPPWCPGDQNIGGSNVTTTFIFREPDTTPWNNTDNPVINTTTCNTRQIPAFTPGGANPTIHQMLHPSDGRQDAQAVINTATQGGRALTFAEMFHRYSTLCSIPAGQVVLGKYVIQIRTNANSTTPTQYDAANTGGGHNRYSMRTGFGTAGVTATDGSKVAIFAGGRLPVYANATGATPIFYLARILPYDAGRILRINLYDMGDASAAGTLQILPPAEYAATMSGCTFSRDNGGTLTVDTGTCTLSNVSSGNGYNGRIVTVDVPIPDDYTCTTASSTGCWFRIKEVFPGGTADTTTWTATVVGNPVRLVE